MEREIKIKGVRVRERQSEKRNRSPNRDPIRILILFFSLLLSLLWLFFIPLEFNSPNDRSFAIVQCRWIFHYNSNDIYVCGLSKKKEIKTHRFAFNASNIRSPEMFWFTRDTESIKGLSRRIKWIYLSKVNEICKRKEEKTKHKSYGNEEM